MLSIGLCKTSSCLRDLMVDFSIQSHYYEDDSRVHSDAFL